MALTGTAGAQDEQERPCIPCVVFGAEAGFALISVSAAENPSEGATGMLMISTLLTTAVLGSTNRDADISPAFFTAMGGLAALGVYNALELTKDKYSMQDRFWHNEIGFHLAALSTLGVYYLTRDDEPDEPHDKGPHPFVALSESGAPVLGLHAEF